MELIMYVNGELLDSVHINAYQLQNLHSLRQQLEDKHSELLDLTDADPEFFIDGVPSRFNPEPTVPTRKIIRN